MDNGTAFVNAFMSKIVENFAEDKLFYIKTELLSFIQNYTITIKETRVVPYTGYIPECYKFYMVAKKIEGLSDNTLKLYDLYLKDFFLNVSKDIAQITINDIRAYLYNTQKIRKISNRTLDSRRSAIHAFMEWACNEEYISKNPCKGIAPIKYEKTERKPLTDIELQNIRNSCMTLRDKAMIECFYSTGCRVTEMEHLNISDIDFNKGEVTLLGKGNKHRISYINSQADLALRHYLESRKDENGALFVSKRAPYNRLKKAAIEKIIRKIGLNSNINERLFPHKIRHTTASDCLNRGMDITKIQKILGHSNLNTTMIYCKIANDSIKLEHAKCII